MGVDGGRGEGEGEAATRARRYKDGAWERAIEQVAIESPHSRLRRRLDAAAKEIRGLG